MKDMPKKKFIFLILLTAPILIYFFMRVVFVPQILDRTANGLEQHFNEQDMSFVPPLHYEIFISDLHADTLLWNRSLVERANRGHVDIPRMIEGNIALQAFSIVTQAPRNISIVKNENTNDSVFWLAVFTGWPFKSLSHLSERALYQVERLKQASQERDDFFLITAKAELQSYLEKRRENKKITAGWLTVEGAQALDGDLSQLDRLYDAGIRMISPAHLTDSNIGGSQQGSKKHGLTELGKLWVKKMDSKKMIIDLAHASTATIEEILELSDRAPLVSHIGAKGACDNNRNLSDELIKKIAKKGGLIGIGFWDMATCGNDIDSIVRSLIYVKNLVGIEFVALGSDWDGYVKTPMDASQIGLLTAKLIKSGLNPKEVSQIMGSNVLEFLLKNLP